MHMISDICRFSHEKSLSVNVSFYLFHLSSNFKHLNTLINVVFFFVFSQEKKKTNEKLCLPRVLTICVYILKSMDLFIFG